jgi:hypothetical protein
VRQVAQHFARAAETPVVSARLAWNLVWYRPLSRLNRPGGTMVYRRLALLAFSLFLLSTSMRAAPRKEDLGVSVSNLSISTGEVIVSFEIDVTAGAIKSISNVPVGWYIIVDNDPSWQTKIKGNVRVGSASLSVEDFRKLQFVVEKNEFGDLSFGLSGLAFVTSDYNKQKQVPIMTADFAIVPYSHR